MDYRAILNKCKDLNHARIFLEEEIEDRVTNAIKERVKENGYTDIDGAITLSIPTNLSAEVTPKGHTRHCFIHEVYYNPQNDRIGVIGSYEILLDNENVDCSLDKLSIDEKINVLQSMID